MSLLLRRIFCLAVVLGMAAELSAQPPGLNAPTGVATNAPVAVAKSPVELFRRLLAMTPAQREQALAERPAENRRGILRKIQEYEKMSAGERELKLQVTELRWYLPPLMRMPRADRAATLAAISESVRKLVEERLLQWDLLPPPLQMDALGHQSTLGYFAGQNYGAATNSMLQDPPLPPGAREELTRLRRLSQPQYAEVIASFQKFYDLSAAEKQVVLLTLSADQRAQLDKSIQMLGKLPREERDLYVAAVSKLASLNDAEQREFLRNAERWQGMTPEERQVWRQIANRLPPLPPMPPGIPPPLPPRAAVGTAELPLTTNNSQ